MYTSLTAPGGLYLQYTVKRVRSVSQYGGGEENIASDLHFPLDKCGIVM